MSMLATHSNKRTGLPLSMEHRAAEEIIFEKPVCRRKPECKGCPFPKHGFICWFSDGSCVQSFLHSSTPKADAIRDKGEG